MKVILAFKPVSTALFILFVTFLFGASTSPVQADSIIITLNPVSVAVGHGQTATFMAAASGTPTPTMQWQLSVDGGASFADLAGATKATFSFTAQSANNGDKFRVVFTNSVGNATSTAATLTVDSSPQVTLNPANQPVSAGTVATFTAAAIGTPTPTMQWQLSVDGGASFADLTGATATTFSFTAQASQNGNQYRAVFTNPSGSATTTAATLTVSDSPQVTANPGNQSVSFGTVATFTATASGDPTPTVQWQMSSNDGATVANIAGATGTTLSFTAQASQNGNQYRAVFTNPSGSATTTAATLTVTLTAGPAVTLNPVSLTVSPGQMATFTAAASGDPVPTMQWQLSLDGGMTFGNMAGATRPAFSFTAQSGNNGIKIRAVFTNSVGNATSTAATLTVNSSSPQVTANPASQSISAGNVATFTAAASGTPTPTVQWQSSSNGGATFANIIRATGTTLSFTANASQDGNQYRAVFTNPSGTATTIAATLKLMAIPVITLNPVSVTVSAGQMATFTAAASGDPTPMVQWQLSVDGGTNFNDLAGATETTFSFTAQSGNNGIKIRAVFTNSLDTATTTTATLMVDSSPQVTANPGNQPVSPGNVATFKAVASGTPTPTVQWQMSNNGGGTFTNIPGATATKLSFTAKTSQNGRQYRAVFTNSWGIAMTTAATLTVSNRPQVKLNPASQSVGAGKVTTFKAAASGNPTPTVRWQFSSNGGATFTNIAGATTKTLSFKTKASQNGNQYRAVFKNKFGSAITTAAMLTVEPTVALKPERQTAGAGDVVTVTTAAALTIGNVPQLTTITITGNTVNLSGINAVTGSYVLVTSTSLATDPAQWTPVVTNTLNGASNFNVSISNQYSNNVKSRFYRYRTP